MANDGYIEFLSPGALEELEKASNLVEKLANQISGINNFKAPISPSGADKTIKEMNNAYTKYRATIESLTKQLSDLAQQRKNEDTVIRNQILTKRELQKQVDAEIKTNLQVIGLYGKINAELNVLKVSYRDLALKKELGEKLNKREQDSLTKSFEKLTKYDQALKKVDASMGIHGRSVGNYASGFNPLSNSISQITRELPNFGQSMQIGILSLTNNIGAFQDAITGIKEQNKILQQEGKATKSVFSQVGAAFMSWNTLLYVGIGLLSAYGKEIGDWVSSLWQGNKALTELNQRQEEFNNSRLTGRKDAQAEILELRKYLAVVNDAKLSEEQRKIAKDALLKQYPYYIRNVKDAMLVDGQYSKGVTDLITALEKRKEVEKKSELNVINKQKLIDLKNELDQNEKLISKKQKLFDIENAKPIISDRATATANRQKLLKAEESLNNAKEKSIEIQKNIEAITKASIKNDADIIKLKKETIGLEYQEAKIKDESQKQSAQLAEKRRKDEYDLEVSNIKREIERAKDKFNIVEELNKNELGYFENGIAKKMKLSMDLAVLELKLAQKVADEKIRLAKGNKALGIAPIAGGDIVAQNEYATESVNIAENFTNRMDKINKDYFKSMQEAVPADWSSKTPTMWTPEQIKQAEEDAKKIAEIQKRLQDEFRNYIQSFGQDFFGNAGFGETFDFFLRMDENGKTMFDKLGDLADGSKEKFAATFQAISESAQEAFNFISEASQRNFEAEYNRLEKQKDVALLFAGESAEARDEIERQYEQRRKEIARREAKAKKQQAIFNIAIDTAQGIMAAVMKSPLTGGLPWSAIVAAIGAAQIAMVSSQEIPQYWKGTDNAEGGLAWTQERGREIITDSQGRVKSLGSDKGAELTMLSKGDKVFTAEKSAMMFDDSLNSMLFNNGIVMPKIEVSMDTQILGSKLDKLSATIASKESFSIVRDAKGERVYQRKQNERKELLNNILNVKTYGV